MSKESAAETRPEPRLDTELRADSEVTPPAGVRQGDPNAGRPEPIEGPTAQTSIDDNTRAELARIAASYPRSRSAILPMLHLVQSVDGRVTPAGIEICAEVLGLTTAEVSAVATFYTMYKRRPNGEYNVGVCTTALCAVMGGDEVFASLSKHLGVGHDETTADGKITLERVECNAACDYAPVMMINWEFMDNQSPDSAIETCDRLRNGEELTSTRGARICGWKHAERVLAGYSDDRADEGPTAGERTRLGLDLAQEHGWRAPTVEEAAEAKAAAERAQAEQDQQGSDNGDKGAAT
jgi:NADH-quinone oxidoreductase subunit E